MGMQRHERDASAKQRQVKQRKEKRGEWGGGGGGTALTNGSSDVKKIRVLVEEGRGGELVFF